MRNAHKEDMEREKIEALLIDYIDGKLTESEREMVEQQYLLRDADAYRLYEQLKEVMQAMHKSSQLEPSPGLKNDFDRLLQSEITTGKSGRSVLFPTMLYRVAAAVTLVAVAGFVVFWIGQQRRHAEELATVKEEMRATKALMMTMLGNQQSASQRLMGATVAFNEIDRADDDIAKALIRAMNEDENTNVRMAALEALAKFHRQPHVRQALIESLSTQKDPIVQIALIRLLVDMREQGIKKQLERITTEEEMLPAVKDEAHAGILKLS